MRAPRSLYCHAGMSVFASVIATCLHLYPSFAQSVRSNETINVFGNWRIDLIKENRSLALFGIVTEGKGWFFSIQCFAEGDQLTIMIPTFDPVEREAASKKGGRVEATVWNEQGRPQTVPMIFMKELGGVAIADKRKLSSPFTVAAFNFLDQLWAAKAFFAFEVGGVTRMYDAKHLSAARSKFDQSCAEIRTNWDDFVGRQ